MNELFKAYCEATDAERREYHRKYNGRYQLDEDKRTVVKMSRKNQKA